MKFDFKSLLNKVTSISKVGETVAVDLGQSSIKIAKIKRVGDRIQLTDWGFIPNGASQNPTGETNPEEIDKLTKEVKNFVSARGIKSKVAATSLMGNFVIVRYVKFPKMSPDELAKSLRFEAEEFIPFDISDVYLSAELVRDVEEEGQPKMESVLVAAKRDVVDARIGILREMGFEPMIIDVDAFCVNNIYEYCRPDYNGSNILLLNIGAQMTTLSISEHGLIRVVRDIPFGGNLLTNLVVNAFACDFTQAEALKKQYGIVPSSQLEAMSDAETAEQVTMALIQGVDEQLITEIQRSIDYFNTISESGEEISRIVLAGGGSQLKNLGKYLNRQLDISVEVFNPMEFVEHPDDPVLLENASSFCVALGNEKTRGLFRHQSRIRYDKNKSSPS